MTPENDKTLRGIFCKHEIGVNEWNDRRDYRIKYESSFIIGQKGTFFDLFLPIDVNGNNILSDEQNTYLDDEEYLGQLSDIFPESKLVQDFIMMMSFGMARDINGNFSKCDCCGINLHALNCGGGYGMCDDCEIENSFKNNKNFDIL